SSRRPLVAAALLCADWRIRSGDVHHASASAGTLLDFCARSEDCDLGQGGSACRRETQSAAERRTTLMNHGAKNISLVVRLALALLAFLVAGCFIPSFGQSQSQPSTPPAQKDADVMLQMSRSI